MDKDKLTPREQALIAAARREAAAAKGAPPPPAGAQASAEAPKAKPAPSHAERLAQLMADEREQTLERKRKMRRRGLQISGGILAIFVLWLLSNFRSTRR